MTLQVKTVTSQVKTRHAAKRGGASGVILGDLSQIIQLMKYLTHSLVLLLPEVSVLCTYSKLVYCVLTVCVLCTYSKCTVYSQ